MKEYHKIQSVFKRDERTHKFLIGQFSIPEFEYLAFCEWEWTEKVDGMNIRVIWDGSTVTFAGKTDNAELHPELFAALRAMFPAEKMSGALLPPMCLYGEGYGAGIQKGGCYRLDKSFVLFDAMCDGLWLRRDSVADIGAKLLCETAPTRGFGNLASAVGFVRAGFNSRWGKFPAEGLVLRPTTELRTRRGDRMITKIKTRDF